MPERVEMLGWASSAYEVEVRKGIAAALAGARIAQVRYYTLDADAGVFGGGPYQFGEASEAPAWSYQNTHSVDFAIEFRANGAVFHISWDPPGNESLVLANGGWAGRRPDLDAVSGVWDVTSAAPWTGLVGFPVEAVDLVYEPWNEDGGYWCTGIQITAHSQRVRVSLGEIGSGGQRLPAANNLLVEW